MTACTCASFRKAAGVGPDEEAERVAAMVAAGIDQWTASRAVWPPDGAVVPPPPMTPAEVPAWVRLLTAIRFPSLRLESGNASEDFLLWIGCLLAASLFIVVIAVGGAR